MTITIPHKRNSINFKIALAFIMNRLLSLLGFDLIITGFKNADDKSGHTFVSVEFADATNPPGGPNPPVIS
jgi:hypothetical protein